MMPEMTKGEYIRFELTKAFIAAKPDIGAQFIKDWTIQLTEAILNPGKAGSGDSTAKS